MVLDTIEKQLQIVRDELQKMSQDNNPNPMNCLWFAVEALAKAIEKLDAQKSNKRIKK
jgi:hypothetical protein